MRMSKHSTQTLAGTQSRCCAGGLVGNISEIKTLAYVRISGKLKHQLKVPFSIGWDRRGWNPPFSHQKTEFRANVKSVWLP